MRAVESLKIVSLIGSFCRKHLKFQMKKYRRMISHAKFEEKLALGCKNDINSAEELFLMTVKSDPNFLFEN